MLLNLERIREVRHPHFCLPVNYSPSRVKVSEAELMQ